MSERTPLPLLEPGNKDLIAVSVDILVRSRRTCGGKTLQPWAGAGGVVSGVGASPVGVLVPVSPLPTAGWRRLGGEGSPALDRRAVGEHTLPVSHTFEGD